MTEETVHLLVSSIARLLDDSSAPTASLQR
jgi:hypothetical protein